ncbi:MAG: cardiolipin synthase B, partial [Lentisphaerae bacterium]|nr:cardiolipin synthase B [Lentisphaerota bacterium]
MAWKRIVAYLAAAALGAVSALLIVNLTPEAAIIRQVVPHTFKASDPQFRRSMSGYSNGAVFSGNAVQTLVNGDEIFPSMLAEIA